MLFSWLAAALAVGGLASLLIVEPADFGRAFHRFTGFLALLLLAAGLAGGALGGTLGWLALATCLVWLCMVQWGPLRWVRPGLWLPLAAAVTALLNGPEFPPQRPLLDLTDWAPAANSLAAALLLGAVSVALLLGHWYLVLPGLALRHLRRMTLCLALALGLRLLLGALVLSSAEPAGKLSGVTTAWGVAAGAAGFFFWQRVGIGLLAPGILTALVDRTVRIGSTQSATGLLYVTSIFVLMGEMIARYLFLTLGIPG
ncbi:MAG TPA: hypothetical protein VFW45_17885 [Candidatus Polarisedimenticolia bacterium]|nr:hypothetical protein [Candidatus Polarisedimenticolia bacterium]